MRNIWTLAKREFAAYFGSPIAYVAITVFLAVVGVKFFIVDDFFKNGEASLRGFFELVPLFFVFYLPAIAMRSVSEEKRQGTFELLVTLPISDAEIILGKYFGSLLFLIVSIIATFIYPLIIHTIGKPDLGATIGGYLGLLLVGAAFLAAGIMASTWSKTQIVSYILGAVICAIFFFTERIVGVFWEGARDAVAYISFDSHYSSFTRGIMAVKDILFFVSMTALFLIVSTFSVNSRRWK